MGNGNVEWIIIILIKWFISNESHSTGLFAFLKAFHLLILSVWWHTATVRGNWERFTLINFHLNSDSTVEKFCTFLFFSFFLLLFEAKCGSSGPPGGSGGRFYETFIRKVSFECQRKGGGFYGAPGDVRYFAKRLNQIGSHLPPKFILALISSFECQIKVIRIARMPFVSRWFIAATPQILSSSRHCVCLPATMQFLNKHRHTMIALSKSIRFEILLTNGGIMFAKKYGSSRDRLPANVVAM